MRGLRRRVGGSGGSRGPGIPVAVRGIALFHPVSAQVKRFVPAAEGNRLVDCFVRAAGFLVARGEPAVVARSGSGWPGSVTWARRCRRERA